MFLSKQKSCKEFRHSENNSNTKSSFKEHQTPIYSGGSMRFAGKIIPGRSSISSSTSSSASSKSSDFFDSNQIILPGRLSVDENALRRRSPFQMRSDSLSDNSEIRDIGSPFTTGKNSPSSYTAPTLSSINSGIEVPSKYMNPLFTMHNSPKKSKAKTAMKRANSLSLPSEWESSPSRLGSLSPINPSFSSSKPPNSSRGKKNLLHMGLDLIKGKKGGSKLRSSSSADMGKDTMENVHQLRLLQNSWMQWRFANARSEIAHDNLAAQCENDLLYTRESMANLRQSVVQKRLQLQKEKLEMKLNMILHSQTKLLEAWGDIERRHIVNVSMMKDYLHAVVCKIPLIKGAKVDLESASIAFQHTSDLVATIKSTLSSISPMAQETIITLSELLEIVTLEKSLLEECCEHLGVISTLEIQERNLRCDIIAMDSLKDRQQKQQNAM
ncbi:hypothetical protein L2E82_41647 [Cichorium intybus]|uniref:Uncharacterized protein n=1 Tax=Cichorium intybus TaxID=13427 RepID=A0ACB8ZJS1_CICIN|nr:hypothetical protein L2E82_41647 [Cichorium intybus]